MNSDWLAIDDWLINVNKKWLCIDDEVVTGVKVHEIYVWARALAWVLASDDRRGRATFEMGRATYILRGEWDTE